MLLRNHIIFTSANEVDQICSPLKSIGISTFDYTKVYQDGSRINLSNTPDWLEHFYKMKYYQVGEFEGDPACFCSGAALWSTMPKQGIFNDAKENFNICNGFTIIEKDEHYCEFFHFGTTRENYQIINLYLSGFDLFKKFIRHFKLCASPLLKKVDRQRLILPGYLNANKGSFPGYLNATKKGSSEFDQENWKKEFIHSMNISLNVLCSFKEKGMTKREIEVGQSLLNYLTIKEIANTLSISSRTVETHLNSMKLKLGCFTKGQLIKKLIELGLHGEY